MRKSMLPLLLLLFVGSQFLTAEIIPMTGLGKPDSITLFKNRLYITDQDKILIYSQPDCRLIKAFGRSGEGPGEFKVSPLDKIGLRISITEENILVNSMGKFLKFTLDGTFIEEKRPLQNSVIQILKPMGNQYVGFNRVQIDNKNYFCIYFYDPETLQKVKDIRCQKSYLADNSINIIRFALLLKNDTRRCPIYQVYNDKLFIEGEDCRIDIFDSQGQAQGSFSIHDYEKLEITEDIKKETMQYLEKRLPTAFIRVKQDGAFPQYFPLRFFLVADEKVYVQTFKKEKDKSEFYIFDLNGKLLSKTMIPFQDSEFLRAYPFTISQGKIYQLIENDDTEEWELHIEKI